MFNRRKVMHTAVAAIAASAVTPTLCAAAGAGSKKMNILLLLGDDWGWQGSEAVDKMGSRLPTLERIARNGVFFKNAFVTSPSCTPSRGSILTGKWPWQLEEGANLSGLLPAHFKTYTELLEDAGYHVGYSGKGWGPGILPPERHSKNPAGAKYGGFEQFMAKRPSGSNFCFWFGSKEPHRPYEKGIGERSGIDLSSLTVPPYLPDTREVRSDIADYRYYAELFDANCGRILDQLERTGELDNTLVVLAGDNGWPFPRAKGTVYDAGCHVPLLVMCKALTQESRASDAMVSLNDLAATFLDAANVPRPDFMDESESLLPFLQTKAVASRPYVLSARERHTDGGALPGQGYPIRAIRTAKYLYIINLRPERWPVGIPPKPGLTEAQLSRGRWAGFADVAAGPTKGLIVARGKEPDMKKYLDLATAKRPPRELFDIATDPYQLHNLAEDPGYRHVVAELDQTLRHELRRTRDPRIISDSDIFDQYPADKEPGFERPPDY